jgi:hypothetical protein
MPEPFTDDEIAALETRYAAFVAPYSAGEGRTIKLLATIRARTQERDHARAEVFRYASGVYHGPETEAARRLRAMLEKHAFKSEPLRAGTVPMFLTR